MKQAPEEDAVRLVEQIIQLNDMPWIWARLFMVAAERKGSLAETLVPMALQMPFLRCMDTSKDALDLLVAAYSKLSPEERIGFEEAVLANGGHDDDNETELRFRRRVFAAIGAKKLQTDSAKALLASSSEPVPTNERPYRLYEPEWIDHDKYWWLHDQGVDGDSDYNRGLFDAIEDCDDAIRNVVQASQPNFLDQIAAVESLISRLEKSGGLADQKVIDRGWAKVGELLARITEKRENLANADTAAILRLEEILQKAVAVTELSAKTEDKHAGLRADCAEALIQFEAAQRTATPRFTREISRLAADASPEVREAVAHHMVRLWSVAPDFLWQLAEAFSERETHERVIVAFLNFLSDVLHHAPARVDAALSTLLTRVISHEDDLSDTIAEGVGSIVFLLWVSHQRSFARACLDKWISDRKAHKAELTHGASPFEAAWC